MRTISAGLLAALGTPGHLVTVERTDGGIVRLNDGGVDIVVGGQTYLGRAGCTVHNIAMEAGGAPATLDIELPVGGDSPITEADAIAGYYDNATVNVHVFSWGSPAEGSAPVAVGKIANIDYNDAGAARFDVVALWSLAAMLRLRKFEPGCGTELGHPLWCQVNMASFTVPATVASVISDRRFTLTVTEPRAVDDWFTRGAGKFDAAPGGGANAGLAFDVRNWTQATSRVDLWVPLPGVVQVGNTLQIHAGCQLTLGDCRDKFNNLAHYQGFPHLPKVPFGGLPTDDVVA